MLPFTHIRSLIWQQGLWNTLFKWAPNVALFDNNGEFCFPDKELALLRGENRRNMLLSVALLAVGALFYYAFFYNDEDSWWIYFKWSTGEQFRDRGDLIVLWTKWKLAVMYLGSACRWRCRCSVSTSATEKAFLGLLDLKCLPFLSV